MADIVLGVCTFRRKHLIETLASIAGLRVPPGRSLTVVVADNDDTPSAEERVDGLRPGFPFDLIYLHAPARNISVARNAIVGWAVDFGARRLGFLDDDETVGSDWLSQMNSQMDTTGAATVLGPVRARYRADAPFWLRRTDLHDTRPVVLADGTIKTGYTCNTLIDLEAPATRGLRFDRDLGTTGGEDTAYFHTLWERGGRIVFAPDATADEEVPADRATLRWLLKRRFRMGQTHGRVLAAGRRMPGRIAAAFVAGGKALVCLGLAAVRVSKPPLAAHALMRASLHLGVISFLAGGRLIEPYGQPPPL